MRIKITLQPHTKELLLPVHHNHILQACIYRNLSLSLAYKIHNFGYVYEKRQFRMFNFSRLIGKFTHKDNNISFYGPITLWISSPFTEILESFAAHIAKKGKIKIGDNFCEVAGIEVMFLDNFSESILINTLSPITAYSTLLTADGKKKTYYYSPYEEDFSRIIHQNLLKKYYIVNKKHLLDKIERFSIVPIKVSKKNEHIIYYKNTLIKAWSGIYKLEAPKELIKIGFDSGLGSKNSQGFGMIAIYNKENL
ncbi:MAG: CRISPR-associated endoribonuclease Cas6 [candidate division WOR-3 bacterium]|nr:CRISPR-associated endoribonuclease Cas6 [candidate division WOR-3 bacterium]MCX7757917.1 CRISPR-associated endoribonuclease Cas6 [candidate division WOR-3 bacterium]MDW7987811.1 CRISPR-associated endoribonuclease Cas6 [candidate division WOR-3 bacterium]